MMPKEFPESLRHTTAVGPDFPGSSGDRERGKFRPSGTPRLDTIAVVNDDGGIVAEGLQELLNELLLHQKATVLGLSIMTGVDLLEEVR